MKVLKNNQYYHRFKFIIGTPFYGLFLRWAYDQCINDLDKLGLTPDFNKKDFTCLLCGCGHEQTADVFIQFIVNRNPKAKIIIIDIGNYQIEAIKKLVKKKYKKLNIMIKQIDALKLNTFIKNDSIDWIETDGFLSYFDLKSLNNLFTLWHDLLKKDGFITIREIALEGFIGKIGNPVKIWVGKYLFDVTLYSNYKHELLSIFNKSGFKYTKGLTPIPFFLRFSFIKKEK